MFLLVLLLACSFAVPAALGSKAVPKAAHSQLQQQRGQQQQQQHELNRQLLSTSPCSSFQQLSWPKPKLGAAGCRAEHLWSGAFDASCNPVCTAVALDKATVQVSVKCGAIFGSSSLQPGVSSETITSRLLELMESAAKAGYTQTFGDVYQTPPQLQQSAASGNTISMSMAYSSSIIAQPSNPYTPVRT